MGGNLELGSPGSATVPFRCHGTCIYVCIDICTWVGQEVTEPETRLTQSLSFTTLNNAELELAGSMYTISTLYY